METLKNKFKITNITTVNGNIQKVTVDKSDLKNCIAFLKNSGEYSVDILVSITAIDFINKIELIYDTYSTTLQRHIMITVDADISNPSVPSISNIFKSASFEEREIFDMFGLTFQGHKDLKKLIMPKSFIGNPMLKTYKQNDERLAWNE